MRATRETVREYIHVNGLLADGARVVVGLSGGPDSVCLARLLSELGFEVVAAHCNFHLRGKESQRDECFVAELCKKQGWTLHRADFDTEAHARRQNISIEMAAREERYDWFRKLKEETKAEAIAVGHHQDDNVETLLLNAVRGTGIRGLCGMQPKNGDVIRPLLCLTRPEIITYLKDIGQDYVTDHTNLEDAYARNKVRLDLLPLMETINPATKQNIASTIDNLTEVEKVYRHAISQGIEACTQHTAEGELHIIIYILLQQPSPISILHKLLTPLGFNKAQLKDILSALTECGKVFMANGHRLLIDRTEIILEAAHYPMPEIHQEILSIEDLHIQKDPRFAYLDADKLHGALTLRTPKEGDTFAPFGMHGKRKLLSDFLTDLKLTLFEKERQPLLMDGEEIAWVVGRRSSDLYRIDSRTLRVLVCQIY